jgi:uncharacterized peroxidase-related enzyme
MFLSAPPDSESIAQAYKSDLAESGFVMNLTRLWAWRLDVAQAFGALRSNLMKGSTLPRREFAVLVCATAATLGDSYCALAWGKTLAGEADPSVAAAVLQSTVSAGMTARDRALAAWARKAVRSPATTTPEDVQELRAAGLSEQEIFEATAFVAFRLAFSLVNDALGVSPDRQFADAAPPEVRSAVTYGRPVEGAARP